MNNINNYKKAEYLHAELQKLSNAQTQLIGAKDFNDLLENNYFFLFLRDGLVDYIHKERIRINNAISDL